MPSKAATPPWQDRAHRVAVVVFDRPPMFELSVAIEVWGNDRIEHGVPCSEVRVCGAEGAEVESAEERAGGADDRPVLS